MARSLPPELIDHVIQNVISPRDLLQLALTCRIFASIIIPNHIEYRQLSYQLYSKGTTTLWKHLSTKPLQCSRISELELELLHTRDEPLSFKLPKGFGDDIPYGQDPQGVRFLSDICTALELMSSLCSLELAIGFGSRYGEPVNEKFEAIQAARLRLVVEKRVLSLKRLVLDVNFRSSPSQQPGVIKVYAVFAWHALIKIDDHST